MRQHLDLHFTSDNSNTDKLLSVYPSALSTRVLRYRQSTTTRISLFWRHDFTNLTLKTCTVLYLYKISYVTPAGIFILSAWSTATCSTPASPSFSTRSYLHVERTCSCQMSSWSPKVTLSRSCTSLSRGRWRYVPSEATGGTPQRPATPPISRSTAAQRKAPRRDRSSEVGGIAPSLGPSSAAAGRIARAPGPSFEDEMAPSWISRLIKASAGAAPVTHKGASSEWSPPAESCCCTNKNTILCYKVHLSHQQLFYTAALITIFPNASSQSFEAKQTALERWAGGGSIGFVNK